jgi:hypothetical protein
VHPLADSAFVDDAGLLRTFEDNPARAEGMLGRRIFFAGRVKSIEHPPSSKEYVLTLAPRGMVSLRALTCHIPDRRTVAALSRSQLVLLSGELRQDRHQDLILKGCRLEYNFNSTAGVVARSAELCRFAEIERATQPANLTEEQKKALRDVAEGRARSKQLVKGMTLLQCGHPMLDITRVCEAMWMDPAPWSKVAGLFSTTCKERHEMLDILNEMLMQGGQTRSEACRFSLPMDPGFPKAFPPPGPPRTAQC